MISNRPVRHLLWAVILLLSGVYGANANSAVTSRSSGEQPLFLSDGETRVYKLLLRAGDILQFEVEQHQLDVKLRLKDPNGNVLLEVDSPIGGYGSEELVEVVDDSGEYTLEVVAPEQESEAGHYQLLRIEGRSPSTTDLDHVKAYRAYRDGYQRNRDKKYSEAGDLFQLALAIWRSHGNRRWEAETLAALANVKYRLGDNEAAADLYDEAGDWFRRLGNQRRLATALQNAGTCWLYVGEMEWAEVRLQEASQLCSDLKKAKCTANTLAKMGGLARQQGRLEDALQLYEEALAQSRAIEYKKLEASTLTDIGGALLSMDQPDKAQKKYVKALGLYQELEDYRNAILPLNGMAEAALRMGSSEKAKEALDNARGLLALNDSPLTLATLRYNEGRLKRVQGDFSGAHTAFSEAARIYREIKSQRGQGDTMMAWGYLYSLEGNKEEALARYMSAGEFYKARRGNMAAVSQVRVAEMLRDLGRLEEAWERIGPALEKMAAIRFATGRRDLRLSFFSGYQDFYGIAIDILALLNEKHPGAGYDGLAFEVHEQRLASELLDSRMLSRLNNGATIDSARQAKIRQLEGFLRQAADVAAGDDEAVSSAITELHRLRGEMRRQRLQDLDGGPPPRASIKTVREELLDDSSRLLVYALGNEHSYLWSISRHDQSLHRLGPKGEIEPDVTRLVKQLRNRRQRIGQGLAEKLLAPVMPLSEERLVVVADGALRTLPFAALPRLGAAEHEYLIERYEIVTLPSATVLAASRDRLSTREALGKSIAIFADPVFTADDERFAEGDELSAGRQSEPLQEKSAGDLEDVAETLRFDLHTRLEESGAEGAGIADLAGDGALLADGFEASRETFEEADLHNYSILHMATHAVLHPQAELAGLVLSLLDEEGNEQDGFIRAFEISRLELPLDMVVLSACETGNGEIVRGEGPLSLAWAFLNSGVSRVVHSLWRVNDSYTSSLMRIFYKAHLKQGLSPAAALRAAQRKMLEEPSSAHPYAWAGFVLQGDWRDISALPNNKQKTERINAMAKDKKKEEQGKTESNTPLGNVPPGEEEQVDDPAAPGGDPLTVYDNKEVDDETRQKLLDAQAAARKARGGT